MIFSATFSLVEIAEDEFVHSNTSSIVYHEIGHAIKSFMKVSVFGQEKDAIDVSSLFLICDIFDESLAPSITYNAAFGFMAVAASVDGTHCWDIHGPE